MVLHLAERLDVLLRERNVLLVARRVRADLSPSARSTTLLLAAARKAVDLVLAGHDPYLALAVDRHWVLVAANCAVDPADRRRRSRPS